MLTFIDTDALSASTLAATRARANIASNTKALSARQPGLKIAPPQNISEFVFGRDGSLTAIDTEGRWLSHSSLPSRVAQEVLKKLELTGTVGCLLAPTHAAQIRIALDRIGAQRAIVAIIPNSSDLTNLLHCEDFAGDITANRLWFASGDDWVNALREIFAEHPGLPSPTQFIKLPLVAGEFNDVLISGAQTVFSEIQKARNSLARSHAWSASRNAKKRTVAIVAPTHFRLWSDHGEALAHLFDLDNASDLTIIHIDPDDPASADPLDLPRRVANCDAIITAEMTRADLPNLLSVDLPWISWLTTPRVPAVESAGLQDHLVLADPTLALKAGWPSHRVHCATWPTMVRGATSEAPQCLALIADTFPIDTPGDLNDFSSHRVLWDTLKLEISNNPFVVGSDPQQYLVNRLKQVGFAPEQFPVMRFVTQLIYPAIAQSIASMLLAARLPIWLYGKGWDSLAPFAAAAAGGIADRPQFETILRQPVALVDVWPGIANHAVKSTGKPVLHFAGNARESYLRNAQRLLSGQHVATGSTTPTLSLRLFREILSTIPA